MGLQHTFPAIIPAAPASLPEMAPQPKPLSFAAATTPTVTSSFASPSSTESAGAIIGSALNAAGVDNSGLSQAQVGGLLGGIIAAIIVVVLIWYWATNTQGYLQYHNNRSYYYRRQGWPSRRRNRVVYEGEVGYDETEEETTDANASARSRRRRRQQYGQTRMSAEEYNAMLAAQYAAELDERARRRRPPGVAVANDFVLNPEPVRFPPTTRRTPYRHTSYPQYPGVRRYP